MIQWLERHFKKIGTKHKRNKHDLFASIVNQFVLKQNTRHIRNNKSNMK